MNEAQRKLNDIFNAYRHTSSYQDRAMVDIMCNREKYEQNLDDMWRIYRSGNMQQVFEYRKQIETIKSAGLQVLRSKSTGKHRIVFQKGE